MLRVRADRSLDPLTLNVLRAFASACGEARSEYFIREEGLPGFPIDLLPFRGVEQTPYRVAWPPDLEVVMSVVGYEDAFAAAEEVELEPGLTMRVVSLPGLAFLKLLAWADAGAQARKQAQDLAVILGTYADAGNQDRLYGDEVDCLAVVDYDLQQAGARLLGQDVRRLAGAQALRAVQELLGNSATLERLAVQMAGGLPRLDDPEDRARRLLEQFASCVRDI